MWTKSVSVSHMMHKLHLDTDENKDALLCKKQETQSVELKTTQNFLLN